MKVAILFCLACVIVGCYSQMPVRAPAGASSAGGSDAARAMMLSRMMRGGGMGGGNNLASLLLLRGGLEPMEYMMCRSNPMLCMMMMQ